MRCPQVPCERWEDHPGPHVSFSDIDGSVQAWHDERPCRHCGELIVPAAGDVLRRFAWKHVWTDDFNCKPNKAEPEDVK